MNILPVGAELLHADGWIDRRTDGHDEANSRFSQFCERSKQWPQDSSNNQNKRYLSFSRYCSLRTRRKKRYETGVFMKSYIQMCYKGSSNGSLEGLSVETGRVICGNRTCRWEFPPSSYWHLSTAIRGCPLQTRLRVFHALWRSILCQHN
jgi:hypothetical protein